MTIQLRQTKRSLAYRVTVPGREPGAPPVIKTFRTKAAAEAFEREMLAPGTRCDEPQKG